MYGVHGPGPGGGGIVLAMTGTYLLGPMVLLALGLIVVGLLVLRMGRSRQRTFR